MPRAIDQRPLQNPEQEVPVPLVGTGKAAEALRSAAGALVSRDADIILTGEPGCGKGHFALYLHQRSTPGEGGTLVELTPSTGEDEIKAVLFGEDRKRLEGILGRSLPRLQERSTLLVRALQEFSFLGQSRIARFLIQNDAARRRGEAGVRVVVAGYDEPDEPATGRRVNESLVAYLRKFERLRIPPLRERTEDIPALVEHFLSGLTVGEAGPPVAGEDFLRQLAILPYPDNIRELRFLVEEAVRCSPGQNLRLPSMVFDETRLVRDLLEGLTRGKRVTFEESLGGLEKSLVRRALIRAGGDRTKAAALLGLSELNFRYRIKKFGIELDG